MLGRHVYRVTPKAEGGWTITMEGGASPPQVWQLREAAVAAACELAAADMPSKVIVESPDGTLADERQFGVAGEADPAI